MVYKFIFFPSFIALAVACTNSRGNDAKDHSPSFQIKEVQDLNQTLNGFKSTKQLPKGNQWGCEFAIPQTDNRLRIGDSVLVSESRNDQKNHFRSVIKKTLISSAPKSMSYTEKYISMSLDEAGGEIINGQPEGEKICYASAQEQICSGGAVDKMMEMLTNRGKEYLLKQAHLTKSHCSVARSADLTMAKKDSQTVDLGQYQMADGQTVSAVKTENEYVGLVSCDGIALGQGSMKITEIKSNDLLPVVDFNFCGGTRVLIGMSVRLGHQIIESSRTETLSGPLRKDSNSLIGRR